MPTQLGWRSNVPGSNLEFVDEDSPLPVQLLLPAGFNTFSLLAVNTNNATTIKPLPGLVLGWACYNNAAAAALVRLYDKRGLDGVPAPATDAAAIKIRIPIPATATGAINNFQPLPPGGMRFDNGIGITITTTVTSDTDNTAVAAGSAIVNIFWI